MSPPLRVRLMTMRFVEVDVPGDGGGFHKLVSDKRVGLSRSQLSLEPARVHHPEGNFGSLGEKAVCDGTSGKLLNGLPPTMSSSFARTPMQVYLLSHLHEGDDALNPATTVMIQRGVSPDAECWVPSDQLQGAQTGVVPRLFRGYPVARL